MIDFLYVVLAGVYDIGNTFLDFITFDTGYHIAFFSAVAAGIGGLLGLGSQKLANKANLQATRETNEMNYKMFKEANAFNEYMSDKAWDRETAYNDPAAQLERYKNAGINGQVAMSGSLGSAGNTPADYAAASSAAPPMFQAPTVQPLNMTPFAEAATAVAQLAQAKKAGAETRSIDTMIDETLEGFKLDNDAKRMANDIVRKYGHAQASENLAKTSAEVSKIWAEYDFAIKNGEYTDELRNKTIEEVKRIIAEADLKKKEADYLQKEIDWYDAKAEQDIRESRSRANANNAQADDSRASAGLKRQMTETEKENTLKSHWEKVAASWNALDTKTRAILNKKYGDIDRFQSIVDKEIDQFVKANSIANPSDIGNKIHSIYDRMLKGIGLEKYNAADRKRLGRDLRNYIMDRLYEEYDF